MESSRGKVLALVLAGGAGGRLDVLTEEPAKPAQPYAGVYRLIDFPLSNCHHSRVSDVWVLQQYQPGALTDHLANGRPWDLDRTHGGLRVVHPYLGADESGWYRGNADAIYRNTAEIEDFDPDLLLVLSADHLYKLDYGTVIEAHLEQEAEVTVVTTRVPIETASRFGTVEVDARGRVVAFAYKPENPETDLVTTEVFVYSARPLLRALAELAAAGEGPEDEESGLADFGDDLLPRLVEAGGAYEYRLDAYWKDVGTIASYWEAHMEQLDAEPELALDDPGWPILTRSPQRPPARIERSASIEDSLVSPGSAVRGRLVHSVLGPGAVVERGATVRDSIVLEDAVIDAGATVECAILDVNVRDGERAKVACRIAADAEATGDSHISVAGRGARIAAGAAIPRGARLKPNSG